MDAIAYVGNGEKPSLVKLRAKSDGIEFMVRESAKVVDTESGAHFEYGNEAVTVVPKEIALKFAERLLQHFERTPVFEFALEGEGVRREIIAEETDTVGEVSHTRRLVIDSYLSEPLHNQVARLASSLLANFPDEPIQGDGAVDMAIRLLEDYAALLHVRKTLDENKAQRSRELIATGLAAGQAAQPRPGETAGQTMSDHFVNAGTRAVPFDGDQLQDDLVRATRAPEVEVAHPDGTNEPATTSLPLGAQVFPDERAYDVCGPQPTHDMAGKIEPEAYDQGGRIVPDDGIPW